MKRNTKKKIMAMDGNKNHFKILSEESIPDKWVVVKIEGKDYPLTYKVFGCWFGGYLGLIHGR